MISSNVTTISNSTYSKEFYCGDGLHRFHNTYRSYHGYMSLVVCLFGSIANLLNIIVLTRPDMRSPTNSILTGLAIADLLVMIEYIPFSWHMYIRKQSRREHYNYYWSLFVLFHSNFAQVCHTVSIWLTLLLAIWRYIAVGYPQRNRQWCSMRTTTTLILLGYIICPILCIPLYLAFNLESQEELFFTDNNSSYSASININNTRLINSLKNSSAYTVENVTIYVVNLSELGRANNHFLSDLNFWMYSIVIKIIPCIALTILSLRLICALIDTKKRREKLSSGQATSKKNNKSSKLVEKEKQTDRTTRMLLAVLLLFLLTEFPQGILGLLSMVLGPPFFEDCYNQLGEVMDILALINSAINFILYCAMSRQFRSNFDKLFRPKWFPLPQNNQHNELTNQTNHYTTTQVTQV
ncbi:unnamed protein product [Bemisia tabaci]|uniref:G-protein coupled receptors family 1 profile domain-containing protein n=1 Tax=Bemisia tabaci TaxID=7038 RepID=A0A9P0F6X9_BEMTA|nr:PREDICTED: sex peptide receptor-like [Bemisia tabaci]CAH0394927.1 unnamed protein product [Bemisia tabaci]